MNSIQIQTYIKIDVTFIAIAANYLALHFQRNVIFHSHFSLNLFKRFFYSVLM